MKTFCRMSCALLFALAALTGPARDGAELRAGFADPPRACGLQAWYHWIGDCVTEEGIVADLAAMKDVGITVAHVFAPSMATLPVKAKPMSEEWMRLFAVAIREAKRNGLSLGFHNCPGWSSSGGPWIAPENSMKIVTAADCDVDASASAEVRLPEPRRTLGFYRDIALYAFPVSGLARPLPTAFPKALGTKEPGTSATFALDYPEPIEPRYFQLWTEGVRVSGSLTVESSEDGAAWTKIGAAEWNCWTSTHDARIVRLSAVRPARRFRMTFVSKAFPAWMGQRDTVVTAAAFSDIPLVENVLAKNSATSDYGYRAPADPQEPGIDPESVVDLKSALSPSGTVSLAGLAARGRFWRIVRIGFTTTGKAPAPATVKGLECDKLDRRGIEAHWAAMPAKILALPGAKETVRYAIIDSYEVGGQNWTERLPEEFARRRGYPLGRNLLSVCGYSLGDAGRTARFLWDYQRTVGELFAENYYDRFAELCHENGILAITEPYGGPYDSLRCGRTADVPTGEFWLGKALQAGTPRIAASIGHLNGRRLIAAESFTTDAREGRWQGTPAEFRRAGDVGWLAGVNQIVFHSYLHQPWTNVVPGLSLGRHGSQFNRNTTWWPEARHWTDYVRRGQFLLQSGRPVADALVLGWRDANDALDAGYDYDLCGEADVARLAVRDGQVVAPSGGTYAVLAVGDARGFSAVTKAKLDELKASGAKVCSCRPLEALKRTGVRTPLASSGRLRGIRRQLEDGTTVWFVVNLDKRPFAGEVTFAAPEGMGPERFDAKTGAIRPVTVVRTEPGRMTLRVELPSEGSSFFVFSRDAEPAGAECAAEMHEMDISDGWTIVSFAGSNPPAAPRTMSPLTSWSEADDPKLRYFSGRAVYERTVRAAPAREGTGSTDLILDLGEVRDVANVWVDGRFAGCVWGPPYRLEIPARLSQSAQLHLRVEVINTWPNRLIGDAIARRNKVPEPKSPDGPWPLWVLANRCDSGTGIFTWSNWLDGWRAGDKPIPAGLLGPVKLIGGRP